MRKPRRISLAHNTAHNSKRISVLHKTETCLHKDFFPYNIVYIYILVVFCHRLSGLTGNASLYSYALMCLHVYVRAYVYMGVRSCMCVGADVRFQHGLLSYT